MGRKTHTCITCGTEYEHCNDCDRISSFVPWRRVACSMGCYQAYLAFLGWRDSGKSAETFKDVVDDFGIEVQHMPQIMQRAYNEALAQQESPDQPPVEPMVESDEEPT